MTGRIRKRLTYANVTATLALFLALTGGAFAAARLPANSVGPAQLRNKAVTPAKVAKGTIKLFKGEKGTQGARGLTGAAGAQGPPGSATAFAGVTGPGTVVSGQTKNIADANITHPFAGIYCFALPFTPTSAVVTGSNLGGANDTLATVYVKRTGDGTLADCGPNDNVRVRTLDLDGNDGTVSSTYMPALANHDFYLWVE